MSGFYALKFWLQMALFQSSVFHFLSLMFSVLWKQRGRVLVLLLSANQTSKYSELSLYSVSEWLISHACSWQRWEYLQSAF